ncbi:sterol desaturase family protein [Tsukamurella pseudospumae]|uniref:Fatty acid hydroxylase domain-containing protein n=1 Tax=Tsukamurella pseudospumae TaxID=239498 RepID=A0A138AMM2_9ACTN|nr:sterol desaturase family protein [Tsukamurella pseudospumae]KXP11662.1 hypothetical protein AXK60_24700 [Tsukamurella pseudospumae]
MQLIAIQIIVLALLGLSESMIGREWKQSKQLIVTRRTRNLTLTVISHAVLPPFSVALSVPLRHLLHANLIAQLPIMVGIVTTVLILDLAGYWLHRMNHLIPLLWRYHQIHHMDNDIDITTGVRVHFLESLTQQAVLLAIVTTLGVPTLYFTVFLITLFVTSVFHHTNVRLPGHVEKWVSRVINTPKVHVIHHHARHADNNSNYGNVFSWWDRIFGTFNRAQHTPSDRLGVSYADDTGAAALTLLPFKPRQPWDTQASQRQASRS